MSVGWKMSHASPVAQKRTEPRGYKVDVVDASVSAPNCPPRRMNWHALFGSPALFHPIDSGKYISQPSGLASYRLVISGDQRYQLNLTTAEDSS